ncbi:NAD(P)-dependent oxidoreductase [Phocicoccus pinnipedialis]|uniref:Glyoxylate/hydroxypyruvate reductase A n=1 Tax=Phocicoccus pinnipedialis TaxID=110845 RepID=A0A6V7RPD1_9BACL|nr:NAD(P)-dependent oxidoreductase [Jeotgalicoccus pinnipedialis]MBP1940259.1 phosphoglycerate dehydrogenase-like enzyme [Jeotgalicoccus pinnipedialis]CAD2079447.1 Glyoxylate/hydroxypyruvate reductase A [Jeotgalicoccus pinnipedialis]
MIVLSTINLHEKYIEDIEKEGLTYKFVKSSELTKADLNEAEIMISYGSSKDFKNPEYLTKIKWLHVMSAGMDEVPKEVFDKCIVTNSSGIHKIQMAEYAVGLILQFYKNLNQAFENQKAHFWDSNLKSEEISGKTAFILGTGNIGTRLAKLLSAFDVKVIGFNTLGREVNHFEKTLPIIELKNRLGEADIVVNILPSTNKTRGLLDIQMFEQMKDSALFLNIGRGDVMTDETMIEVLKNRIIRHMLLDVFNEEPLKEDSVFYEFDNVTITPHASSKTSEYIPRAYKIFKDNLLSLKNDQSMNNVVTFEKGY